MKTTTSRSSYRTKIVQRLEEQEDKNQQQRLNLTEQNSTNSNNNNTSKNNNNNNDPLQHSNTTTFKLSTSIVSLFCTTIIVCILFVWNQNQYEIKQQQRKRTNNNNINNNDNGKLTVQNYNYNLVDEQKQEQQQSNTHSSYISKLLKSSFDSLLLSSSLSTTPTLTEDDTNDDDDDDEFYQVTDNNNNIHHRQLVSSSSTTSNNNNINNNNDPGNGEDETCRTYLTNFVNSTNTDMNVTCTEYVKAYTVADCTSSTNIMYEKEQQQQQSNSIMNSNSVWWIQRNTPDHGDVGLDDTYQTNQCCIVMSNYINEHCTSSSSSSNSNTTSGTGNPTSSPISSPTGSPISSPISSPTDSPTGSASTSTSSSIDVLKLLSIITVLLVCGIVKSLLRYMNIQFIPDAGACIIVGIIVAAILNILNIHTVNTNDTNTNDPEQRLLLFDNDLFLRIMLPPIIFEAALSIDKKAFVNNIYQIVLFSTVGTVMSAVIVGYGTYYISNNVWKRGIELPLIDSLLYGSLMSSIDPVATLSILSTAGVHPSHPLYILIFGESLLNDGIAIVLFDSLIEHMGDSSNSSNFTSGTTVYTIVGDFILISIGSIFIGYICGCFATIYFWLLRNKQNDVTEVSLFFAWALVPYYIADGLKYSGIISIMVMGFMMDYYVIGGCFTSSSSPTTGGSSLHEYRAGLLNNNNHDMHNNIGSGPTVDDYMTTSTTTTIIYTSSTMEKYYHKIRCVCEEAFSGTGHFKKRSQHHVGFVAEVITAIMETAIFAYLGLFLFHDRDFNFKLIISALFSCIVSRGSMVILLCLVINTCVLLNVQGTIVSIFTKLMNLVRRNHSSNANHRYSAVDSNDDINNTNNNTMVNDTTQNGPQRQRNNKKQYLNAKTQMILFSAGIRGAVSYALVQNIPKYDDTTKTGSHYKGELRTMTSVTIIILMFGFGAVTYFIVNVNNTDDNDDILQIPINDGNDNDNNHYRQRLLPHGHNNQDSIDDSTDPSLNPSIVVQQQYQLMNNNTNSTNNSMTNMNSSNFVGPPASAFTQGWGNAIDTSGIMNTPMNTNNNNNNNAMMMMAAASSVATNHSLVLEASIEEQQHRLMYNQQQQPAQEVWQQQQQQQQE